ncbi:MAG TPA: hypothetical protein VF548_15205 [Allosphingosinicella sp.]|jgi:hypothetical protein
MKRLWGLLLLLAGCGAREAAAVEEKIECAVEGAGFEPVCTVERSAGSETRLILRGPDGSFRRLVVTRDGRGVAAADGAEPASVTVLAKDLIEVSIGSDRYRLPAKVR